MKAVKRIGILALTMVMLVSAMAMPASAITVTHFYHFPLVTKSMGGGYMSAAVAVQKFLLLYSPVTYNRVNAAGGTDGFFGEGSANATSYFQSQEGLGVDGKVGSLTWTKIEELLHHVSGIDSGGNYYWYGNASGAQIQNNHVILFSGGYRSVDREGNPKEVFYRPE